MMPTADPIIRLRRYRHITMAVGIALVCVAGVWAFAPGPVPPEPVRTASPLSTDTNAHLVHPERWRVALAPIAAPAPAVAQEPPVAMTLVSIMSRSGGRQAMITVGDGRLVTVAVGGVAGGWTVTAIDERSVTFDKDGTKRVVEMKR